MPTVGLYKELFLEPKIMHEEKTENMDDDGEKGLDQQISSDEGKTESTVAAADDDLQGAELDQYPPTSTAPSASNIGEVKGSGPESEVDQQKVFRAFSFASAKKEETEKVVVDNADDQGGGMQSDRVRTESIDESSEAGTSRRSVEFSYEGKEENVGRPRRTSRLDSEQLHLQGSFSDGVRSFSDGVIDNNTLEYVEVRLPCGVMAMCSPQVLANCPLVLRSLQIDAQRLFTILPRSVHDLLRRTNIWVNASYSYGSFDDPHILRHSTAHHSEGWLVHCARDIPKKACSIEIYDCQNYERMRLHWNGAGLLLHEFCHLIHQFCLDLDNAKVIDLYHKADNSGKYNQTPRRDWAGCEQTHDMAYALVDQKEFFGEMSVAFLSNGYRRLNKADSTILEACCPPLLQPNVFDRVLRQHGIEDPLERPEDSVCYILDYAKRRHPKPKLEIADPIFQERAISTNCRNIPICNKFYPFTRGQLRHYDPSLCDAMGDLWKEITRWKDPETESDSKCSFPALASLLFG